MFISKKFQLEQLLRDEHLSQEVSEKLHGRLLDYKSTLQGDNAKCKFKNICRRKSITLKKLIVSSFNITGYEFLEGS